ncbi:MAG: hypothetical protein J3K34DRAFT_508062 [Monoraphidium minutum]|nr:MAG: hypothetical protein J3K34DRAFT_508062 [Monoraphidium minutum]
MPPKKAPPTAKSPSPGAEHEAEREFRETEALISFLRSKLGRYQQQGDKLQVENFRLSDELEAQKLNLRDINEFLTNELKARTAANAALEERGAQLAAQLEDTRRACEAEVARAAADAAREVAAMAARLDGLQRQAAGSSEFLERRDALEAELAGLQDKLARRARNADARVAALERQHLADKERWRREAAARVKETKMQMAQLADQHLEGTTKRALLENGAVASELAYHSAQSARLMAANAALRGDAAELRRQVAIAQRTGESVARKNAALQKIFKAILGKLREEGTGAAAAIVAAAAGSCGGGGPGAAPHAAFAEEAAAGAWQEEQQQREGCAAPWEVEGPGDPQQAAAGGGVESAGLEDSGGAAGGAAEAAGAAAELEAAAAERALSRIESLTPPLVGDDAAGGAAGGAGAAASARGALPGRARGPGAVVVDLSERVAALQSELDAARQALADAAGLAATAPVPAPAPAPAPVPRRSASPAAGAPPSPGKRGPAPRASAGGASAGGGARCATGVAPALADGAAAFALFAVQQLRGARPPAAAADAAGEAGGGAGGGAAEWLAQHLLELLHSYDPEQTAPFRGLQRPSTAQAAQEQPQQQGTAPPLEQQREAAAAVAAAPPSPSAARGLPQRGRAPSPLAPMAAPCSGGGLLQLQLPALLGSPHACGTGGGGGGGGAPGAEAPSVEQLLIAVMSDVRPWGRQLTPEPQPFTFAKRIVPTSPSGGGAATSSGGSPLRQRPGASPTCGLRR